jgi:Response regulators consisting of a CheY-like receiver domain and a winged-helix DNA-binding domain
LAISYSIIRKHGGFLHLEGSSPAGATFAFYLPAARGKVMSDSLQPNDRSFHFNHQRILVMDDESAIRELTSQLLATMGYEVTAVPDGSEAVRFTNALCARANTSAPSSSMLQSEAAWAAWKRSSACAHRP